MAPSEEVVVASHSSNWELRNFELRSKGPSLCAVVSTPSTLRSPLLGGTVFASPELCCSQSRPQEGKKEGRQRKKVENLLWGKLGTTRNGETWFPGKTDIWEANRPHYLPRGTRAPFRKGVRGTRLLHWPSAASPSPVSLYLFHSLCQPLFAPEGSPRAPPSSIVYPHGNRLLYLR